jgi:hypothetical protein
VDLLSEALTSIDEPFLHPGPGPLRTWLRRELTQFADVLNHPASLQFMSAIIANGDRDQRIADLRDELMRKTTRTLATKIERSRSRDLLDAIDASTLLLQLVGPIIVQVSILRRPADKRFIAGIIDAALAEHS